MLPELFTSNHGLLFTALAVLAITIGVFAGICYWMGNSYVKEHRENDPNYIKPKKQEDDDKSDS